jgi:uncharacterized protein
MLPLAWRVQFWRLHPMPTVHKSALPFTQKSVLETGHFQGYASVFNVVDTQNDIVLPGAFQRSIQGLQKTGNMPKLLWQHQVNNPIGVIHALREDSYGLLISGQLLNDVQQGQEALALLDAGAIKGLSIGYQVVEASRNAAGVRLLHEVALWEVSLVTFAANPQASVVPPISQQLRELANALKSSV